MSKGYDQLREILRDMTCTSPPIRTKGSFTLALGPCVIESQEVVEECARAAAAVGAVFLRGGATKLRTRIHTFQGHGIDAWRMLRSAAENNGLRTVSEVTAVPELEKAVNYLDMLQIGARSMWNFSLIDACISTGLPILLKRGLGSTTAEWLGVAERILSRGGNDLILCERGIPSIDPASRNSADIATMVFLANECELPVWLDVSHTSGDPRVARALLAVASSIGLDGAMAEIHPTPSNALCDGKQAILLNDILDLSR